MTCVIDGSFSKKARRVRSAMRDARRMGKPYAPVLMDGNATELRAWAAASVMLLR